MGISIKWGTAGQRPWPSTIPHYINDLPREVKNCIRLFADDTKLYRTVTTDLDCLSLQQDIDNIEEWASKSTQRSSRP